MKRLLKKSFKRLIILTLFLSLNINASFGQSYVDATSQKWNGTDVTTILGNSIYEEDTNDESQGGFSMILYNVGTGRFVIQGGDWGIEGRLFYPDFGRVMRLYSSGRINSGVTESNISDTKNSFGVNIPGVTKGSGWQDVNNFCYTTIMDAPSFYPWPQNSSSVLRHWNFVRVESPDNTQQYTYYMTETIKNKDYHLGACYGEWGDSKKGIGKFVYLDDDRTCWTTAPVIDNDSIVTLQNGNKVEIQKLYQWRIISQEEYLTMLNSETAGLNPSISSLIPDRDFTRNSNDFYDYWKADSISDSYAYSTDKRYTYTFGNYKKKDNTNKHNQQSRSPRLINEPWNNPVMLKVEFDGSGKSNEENKKNAKFGFMLFEGIGYATTNVWVPKAGWYAIECTGFVQSENDNPAYFFGHKINGNQIDYNEYDFSIPNSSCTWFNEIQLYQMDNDRFHKQSYDSCVVIGKELTYNAEKYKQKIWVLITEDDFENGYNYIRIGIRKNDASKSKKTNNGYYDTDMVCIDNLQMTYMGIAPIYFYEDEEDLQYLNQDNVRYNETQFINTAYNKKYGGAICLERQFKTNMWNSFSFPIPLTGEQIRSAFGERTELLKLHSIGCLSNSASIIDFKIVDLMTTDYVIEPEHMYLIKPLLDATKGKNPKGIMTNYYIIGKNYFSTDEEDSYDMYFDLSKIYGNNYVISYQNKNDATEYVTYTQTPGYSLFTTLNKKYNGIDAPNDSYATAGSYVISNGNMYKLSKDTRIKGFRGWISLNNNNASLAKSNSLDMQIGGNSDNISTDINNISSQKYSQTYNKKYDGKIYNIVGLEVKTLQSNKLYIINNKKVIIR